MSQQKQSTKTYSAPDVAEPNTSHRFMLDMVGSGKRVLEFGCATGYMSRAMAAAGCRVTAIEVDPAAAAAARNHCEEVIVADLDVRPLVDLLPATPFDVAVFGDVLEHLRDPWTVLDDTRKLLGPSGFVVISIPNVAHGAVRLSLLDGTFEYSSVGLLDDTHLRFFTLRTVRELCMRAGFRILEIERTKLSLFVAADLVPHVREDRYDPAVVARIREDPEHDTLQFIVKAVPLRDDEKYAWLVAQVFDLEAKLLESERTALAFEERLRIAVDSAAASERSLRADLARREEAARLTDDHVRNLEAIRVDGTATIERLSAELVDAQARYDALQARNEALQAEAIRAEALQSEALAEAMQAKDAPRLALEAELEKERAEFYRLREAYADTIARFRRLLEVELVSTRTRAHEIDSAIAAIQRGALWKLKRAISTFTSRGRRRG